MNHDHSLHDSGPKPFWGSRYSLGLIGFGVIATYLLFSEHRAHFLGALPLLILLACPLMHVFMHHGHGGHGAGHNHQDEADSGSNASTNPRTDDREHNHEP